MAAVEEMVERVWPGRCAEIEALGGGITNRNFKVSVDGETYVLRIGGKDTSCSGSTAAPSTRRRSPPPPSASGPRWSRSSSPRAISSRATSRARSSCRRRCASPSRCGRVAQALRAIHGGPPIPARFDSFRVVEAYAATAAAHGGIPPAFERARELAVEVERARGPVPERPCHNDLLTANFIDDGTRIRIVDWEYAGMGDVYFDLANFAVNNSLPLADAHELLGAYFGEVTAEHERSLVLMRFMSDFREAMWGSSSRPSRTWTSTSPPTPSSTSSGSSEPRASAPFRRALA